jgi:hypothetical protein
MSNENTDINNALDMSDEEFMKMDPSAFEGASAAKVTEEEPEPEADDDAASASPDGENPPDTETPGESDGEEAPPAPTEKPTEDQPADEQKVEKPAGDLTDAQYIEIGKQIMSEFKANGTSIKVKSADDAIQLMQMGANYHKKMIGLKPSLKVLKLLENHNLLDPDKVNFLIDLNQKKPEAIAQLLKDGQIDPLNIDMDKADKYVPPRRSVSDTELQLDEILESISHSPSYNRTLTVLGDQWDEPSRQVLAKNPEFIRTINAHMESGIFDQVAEAVSYERRLGKLSGVSDFEAYQRIGTYMHENKLFKGATGSKADPATQKTTPPPANKPSETAEEAEARKQRKQAVSPSRHTPAPAAGKQNYNPLAMSDEDFIKFNKLSL